MTDINNYVNQSIASFITGKTDLQGWSNYVSTIKSMGIADAVKMYQDKYDAYMKIQKK